MEPIDPPVKIVTFPELVSRLAEAAGATFEPGPGEATSEQTVLGEMQVTIERREWVAPSALAWVVRETGDNGATHHMAWAAHFRAEAEVILPDAVIRFEGGGWGADELQRFAVEANEPLRSRLKAIVRSGTPA